MEKSRLPFLLMIIFLAVGFNNSLFAQANETRTKNIEATFPLIDQLFSASAMQNHLPGAVYGLIVDGRLFHSGNTGYSNFEEKIPADNNSAFHIPSMTKSFTAMAILKLRDEGKLKLDDPVYLYIPEMKGQKYPSSDASDITIRNLLTHGAGARIVREEYL